ncbi:MAG: intermembrane transport protein PqiB [Paraglaciecola sp.]|uniref:intermembrane transport protein PqiB n=2 Tax=Paraglaciecola sp. TaxID=1920173 RepID=UPI0032643C83
MTNSHQNQQIEDAIVTEKRSVSKIWLIPLITLLIALWMTYYHWANQGPLITIEFDTATGLEAGKTKVKTRDVDIGVVNKIVLSDDLSSVLVTVRMDKDVDTILHQDNQFWIVSPRVSLSGVSGLGTILSGPYINMAPGIEPNLSEHFIALNAPPVTPAGTPGLHVTLNSETEFAYKKGDPVIYKGIKVGEFEDINFNFEERVVYYNTFIQAPYHELITTNTKFWDISGAQVQLGASGVNVSTGSIESILTNGVTFGIPEGLKIGERVTERDFFDIHPSYSAASEERYKFSANFVIYVKDTVRGLQVGAPVEYRGLVVGKVLSINETENQKVQLLEQGYDIPVTIGIQPGRIQQPDTTESVQFIQKQIQLWVEKGLRATLKTGNLLTGALFVDLQHYPEEKYIEQASHVGLNVIPTVTGEFSQITEKVTAILDNINQIKMQNLSANANLMLTQISEAANALETTASKVDLILDSVQEDKISRTLATTLQDVSSFAEGFSEESQTYQELNHTMSVLQQTLKDLQPLLQQLNSTPNSFIFTDGSTHRITPKGKTANGESN